MARERPGLIPVGCWAHARRKFVEAAALGSAEAAAIVTEIRKLHLLEARARDEGLRPEQRREQRQQRAAPILAALPVCVPAQAGSRADLLGDRELPAAWD